MPAVLNPNEFRSLKIDTEQEKDVFLNKLSRMFTQLTGKQPLASSAGPGLMAQTSGHPTDYIGGDNQSHPLSSQALASPTGPGLMATTSGNATDYIGGDNASHPLSGVTINAGQLSSVSTNLGTVATNQTVACANACSISVNLAISAAVTLTLNNVGNGVPIFLRCFASGGTFVFKVTGTNAGGGAFAAVNFRLPSAGGGGETSFSATGASITTGTLQYYFGMAYGPAMNAVFFVAC